MSGIKKCILELLPILGAIAVTAIGGLLVIYLEDIKQWEFWDRFVNKEPMDMPVVLSPKLQYDTKGNLTERLRIALERMGVDYRIIDREFPVLPPIVPSGEVSTMVIEQGKRLLEQHGGDVIVYGNAGTTEGHIFLRLFIDSDCGCVHGATPFDLTGDDWETKLKWMIVTVMNTALNMEYHGDEWLNSELPLSHLMRIWEKKFGKLAELAKGGEWEEETSGFAVYAKLHRIKTEGDGSGIQELWKETLERLSEELVKCRTDGLQCHIRRELLFLADLAIFDGLMNDLPEQIEEGLSLALLAGEDVMKRETSEDPNTLQPPIQSGFKDWLSMANLVLACDDQTAMGRFVNHMHHYLQKIDSACFRGGDVERMLWPMEFLRRSNISNNDLEEFHRFLSKNPYFGWPQPDFWQDPFLHAKRSIRRRLHRMELEHAGQLDNRFLGLPQCPSLSKWMEFKGWGDVSDVRRIPDQENGSNSDLILQAGD